MVNVPRRAPHKCLWFDRPECSVACGEQPVWMWSVPMKIIIVEAEQWEQSLCSRLESEHQVVYSTVALTRDTIDGFADAEVISPFVDSRLDAELLARLPRLRLGAPQIGRAAR